MRWGRLLPSGQRHTVTAVQCHLVNICPGPGPSLVLDQTVLLNMSAIPDPRPDLNWTQTISVHTMVMFDGQSVDQSTVVWTVHKLLPALTHVHSWAQEVRGSKPGTDYGLIFSGYADEKRLSTQWTTGPEHCGVHLMLNIICIVLYDCITVLGIKFEMKRLVIDINKYCGFSNVHSVMKFTW